MFSPPREKAAPLLLSDYANGNFQSRKKCVENGDRRFPVGGKQMAGKQGKRGRGISPAIKKRLIETKSIILHPARRRLWEHPRKQARLAVSGNSCFLDAPLMAHTST